MRHDREIHAHKVQAYAISQRDSNLTKAMTNWQEKSAYLLKELIKFKTYVESLQAAIRRRERALAVTNWERKSSYLLREIIKFETHIVSLEAPMDNKKVVLG